MSIEKEGSFIDTSKTSIDSHDEESSTESDIDRLVNEGGKVEPEETDSLHLAQNA